MGTMETSNDSSHFKKHSETLGGFAFLFYLCIALLNGGARHIV